MVLIIYFFDMNVMNVMNMRNVGNIRTVVNEQYRQQIEKIEQLKEAIMVKIKSLGLESVVSEEGIEKIQRMNSLKMVNLTPREYHKKVMLFTLPQFLISFYASLYSVNNGGERVILEYLYHSHHVFSVLGSSILYWSNYDSDDEKRRKILRRFDMTCVCLSTLSLYWRASKYSRGLTKATLFANIVFIGLFISSHNFNKRYPYKSIWLHSLAHTSVHLYNIHYFMTVYRIKMWKLARMRN